MIEIPEAKSLSVQIKENLIGKKINNVKMGYSPHKFAWFNIEKEKYHDMISGKTIQDAYSIGGILEVSIEDVKFAFHEGIKLRYHKEGDKLPKKHQMLIEFDDMTTLIGGIQMYGGFYCFYEGEFDNKYYINSKNRPDIFSKEFDNEYFLDLLNKSSEKLSVKAFLATEQRIPGLGNGVLQDILYNAKIHPKKKLKEITDKNIDDLFNSIKNTLLEMFVKGGRDTEKDLFGCSGGYKTKCSKNTVGAICSECKEGKISKQNYMGGSIYLCEKCQVL